MPKIALIYDHLATQYGGAEKVLLALHTAFPDAPLYTSVYDQGKVTWSEHIQVHTSFLQHIPFAKSNHRLTTIIMPVAFETLNLDEFNIIISVSSTSAKGILTKPHQLHITYLLTPTRFIFSHQEKYLSSNKITTIAPFRYLAKKVLQYLSWWDLVAAQRADNIVTISNRVSKRCEHYYQRTPATIIYPPVSNIEEIPNKILKDYQYFLCLSRLVSYKRIDLCIESTLVLQNPLIIAGEGPDKKSLSQLHPYAYIRQEGESIEAFLKDCFRLTQYPVCFVGAITEREKAELLSNAQALLMPGEEDFGITALEAASVGIPSILHKKSGASEILDTTCVVHINNDTIEEMVLAIKKLKSTQWSATKIKSKTIKYETKLFIKAFKKYVKKEWQTFQESRLA